jgi:RNA polymerase sigma-70 factor, ECF subfamily
MTGDARRSAEAAARASYGRLLALIASGSGDVAGAEDALATAFVAALSTWPERGIPDRPEAWLLTAARRAASSERRHRAVRSAASETIELLHHEAADLNRGLPDRRLALLFVCAHPAIDEGIRTPLMLQTVLGLDAARIAAAFLIAPATMGQRLVRAKAKIRKAGIPFTEPETEELPGRLEAVLDAIYAAYGTGWDALPGAEPGIAGLAEEAVFLARLVVSLLPEAPEAKGLLALILYCEARRGARRGPEGTFVALAEQDMALWSREAIAEAEALLRQASRAGAFGRFQCEAAIQSLHVQRRMTGQALWPELLQLYDLLAAQAPSLGSLVAAAAVRADAGDAAGALAALDALPPERVQAYQPYWVTRMHVLGHLGRDAREARAQALLLTRDPAIRSHLLSR